MILRGSVRRWGPLGVGFAFIALYLAWLGWGRPEAGERVLVGSLSILFASLAAAWLSVLAALRTPAKRLRCTWAFLAGGLALWSLRNLANSVLLLAFRQNAYQILVLDLLFLVGLLALCVGLAVYPRRSRPMYGRLGLFFDMAISSTAAVTLVWLLVIQPAAARPLHGLAAFYPVADMAGLLLLGNLFLLTDTRTVPASPGYITLGLAFYSLSDLAYAAQAGFQPGGLVDAGWVLGSAWMAAAAFHQIRSSEQAQAAPWLPRLLPRLQSLLPLVLTLFLGGYSLLAWQWSGNYNPLGAWVTVVLGLGIFARQGVLAGEVELQQYANLVNSIAEPAFVCDRHGRLRLINPALLATAGYSDVHELLGRPLDQILSPTEGINALLIQALRVGWLGEYHLRRSSGVLIPISLALRPLLPSGDSRLALAGTAHDLSEEKRRQADLKRAYEQIAADRAELERLNAQLELKVAEKTASLSQAYSQLEEQNRELQQLDEMKTDFVSMVSHELRAPLTNINGGIELLLTGRYDLAQRVRQNLVLVQAEIRRLTRFVETILDLSALEAGRLPLYPGPVALQDMAGGLRAQLSQERISWQIPAGLPPLLADEQALTSVLFHLLDNALKYAPQGKISVTARCDAGRAWIEVSDEGPGIPPEKIPLLFDRFYRASPADSQTVYGHGLGLYIVRRLMEAMHGEVQASNRPEGGASFTLCLELAPKEEEDAG